MPVSSHNSNTANGPTAEVGVGVAHVRGSVRIAPAVLIELIELTVEGIDGIDGLRNRRAGRVEPASNGVRTWDNGKIAVTVNGDRIDAVIAIAIQHGINVSALSAEIQRRIGFAAGKMLGMTVRTVDISIEEIVSEPIGS